MGEFNNIVWNVKNKKNFGTYEEHILNRNWMNSTDSVTYNKLKVTNTIFRNEDRSVIDYVI
jgi:hypothetical protein